VLTNKVTGLDNVDAFHLNSLSFEGRRLQRAGFPIQPRTPVVEFTLPEPGLLIALGAGSAQLAVLGLKRARWAPAPVPPAAG